MNAQSLKKYIYENDKVEFVLSSINCKDIVYHPNSDIYTCCNHNGDNKTAINIKNNQYLSVKNWTRTKDFDDNSDIITLVQYNLSYTFANAVKYLHDILNLTYTKYVKDNHVKSFDPLAIFKKHLSCNKVDISELPELNDNILNDYIPILHISWFREGVMPWTAKKFGIAYSYRRKRIIIPIHHWKTKKLVGINARTTVDNYEELGITKFRITPSYQKSLNLYGLAENYDAIQKAGYVVVVESEKSVLKRDSVGDSTLVALSGHTISEEQVRILISLNVDIIIAMDKDISIDEVKFMCSKFGNTRRVYYIEDKWDLLGDKESPADKSSKIYNFLMKYKTRYKGEA